MAPTLTDREADVMRVLWERGPCSVADVRGRLEDQLAHNTVLTILRILEHKGFVRREPAGRHHRYIAVVAERAARKHAIKHLVGKLFRGSSDLLLAHLVADEKLSPTQVKRLRRLLKSAGPGGPE